MKLYRHCFSTRETLSLLLHSIADKLKSCKVQLYFARMCPTILSDFCLDVFLPLYGRFLEAGVSVVVEPNVCHCLKEWLREANDRFLS